MMEMKWSPHPFLMADGQDGSTNQVTGYWTFPTGLDSFLFRLYCTLLQGATPRAAEMIGPHVEVT